MLSDKSHMQTGNFNLWQHSQNIKHFDALKMHFYSTYLHFDKACLHFDKTNLHYC